MYLWMEESLNIKAAITESPICDIGADSNDKRANNLMLWEKPQLEQRLKTSFTLHVIYQVHE